MEAIRSSETSGATQRTTRRHIPEDDTLHNHRCENLKSYIRPFCNLLGLRWLEYVKRNVDICVRFEIIKMLIVQTPVFWDVTPYSLVVSTHFQKNILPPST
jgi:hypothetical protein